MQGYVEISNTMCTDRKLVWILDFSLEGSFCAGGRDPYVCAIIARIYFWELRAILNLKCRRVGGEAGSGSIYTDSWQKPLLRPQVARNARSRTRSVNDVSSLFS